MSWFRFSLLALVLTLGAVGCSQEVKLGVIVSESGSVAAYSNSVKNGIELALEEVNAAGTVGPVTLLYRDDGGIASIAAQHATELIETEKVSAVLGGISSDAALEIGAVAQKNEVVLLSPTASVPQYSELGRFAFRNYPSDILEGTALAEFARNLGLETVAIFAVDTNYGRGLRNIFTEKFESKYKKVVGDFDFDEGNEEQLREMVQRAKELDPDGIYVVAYEPDIVRLLGLFDELDVEAVMMASSSVTPAVSEKAGEAANGLIYPLPNTWDANSSEPAVRSFVEAYRSKYSQEPDVWSAHGYDALKILVQAVERGGTPHPDNVYMGMSGTKDFEGAAGRTVFDSNGDVVRYAKLYIVQDGSPVPYDEFTAGGGSVLSSN